MEQLVAMLDKGKCEDLFSEFPFDHFPFKEAELVECPVSLRRIDGDGAMPRLIIEADLQVQFSRHLSQSERPRVVVRIEGDFYFITDTQEWEAVHRAIMMDPELADRFYKNSAHIEEIAQQILNFENLLFDHSGVCDMNKMITDLDRDGFFDNEIGVAVGQSLAGSASNKYSFEDQSEQVLRRVMRLLYPNDGF